MFIHFAKVETVFLKQRSLKLNSGAMQLLISYQSVAAN